MYQILVDRFYNGDTSNDVLTDEYYYIQTPSKKNGGLESVSVRFFCWRVLRRRFRGRETEVRLLISQNLGVEVIYFNPLFVSPSNHKYDIQDYDYIDPHYGKIVVDEGAFAIRDNG